MDFKAISNAGPIIHLTRIGKLLILKELFGKIAIPESVKIEIIEKGKKLGKPDALLIEKEIKKWIEILKDPEIKEDISEKSGIHSGELATILIASELNLPLLMDDAPARSVAEAMGVEVVGSIGILIKATQKKLLTKSQALSSLERLTEVMWLNAYIYTQARQSVQSLKE